MMNIIIKVKSQEGVFATYERRNYNTIFKTNARSHTSYNIDTTKS